MSDVVVINGFGSIGQRHARLVRERFPETELLVLRRDCSDSSLPPHAACVERIEDAIAARPRAAIIATPAPLHVESARAFLQAGIPVLVEKPLASSTAELAALDSCNDEALSRLMLGYNLRFLPVMQAMWKVLSEQQLGRVLHVHSYVGQYLPDWRPGQDYRHSVSARSELGGGVLLELSHELDYLCWLFGEPSWVQATSLNSGCLQLDVEDMAHLLIGFNGNDCIANVTLDFLRRDAKRTCSLIGERSSLEVDVIKGEVQLITRSGEVETLCNSTVDRDYSYRMEHEHFFNCLDSGQPFPIGAADGRRVLSLIEAARQSSEQHRRIHLDEVQNG